MLFTPCKRSIKVSRRSSGDVRGTLSPMDGPEFKAAEANYLFTAKRFSSTYPCVNRQREHRPDSSLPFITQAAQRRADNSQWKVDEGVEAHF